MSSRANSLKFLRPSLVRAEMVHPALAQRAAKAAAALVPTLRYNVPRIHSVESKEAISCIGFTSAVRDQSFVVEQKSKTEND